VPSEPFVDLATLDFAHPRLATDEIRKILPHRGHMALLDAVLSVDVERKIVVGYKQVRSDEFWCDGHFPGNPLLPGVMMIEVGAQLAIVGYKLAVPAIAERLVLFGGVDEVRFRGAVRPGDRLVLLSKGTSLSTRLAKSAVQGFVGDKLVFECTVIGVPT
jgi:3-hydroxyacyl-[acyl-carrier-protein] dehydratase